MMRFHNDVKTISAIDAIESLLERCKYVKFTVCSFWSHGMVWGCYGISPGDDTESSAWKHPDASKILCEFNCDEPVFNNGSRIRMFKSDLNKAWGLWPGDAAARALKMLDDPCNIAQCPNCEATQCDLDFELIEKFIQCRICLHKRNAQ